MSREGQKVCPDYGLDVSPKERDSRIFLKIKALAEKLEPILLSMWNLLLSVAASSKHQTWKLLVGVNKVKRGDFQVVSFL